MHRRATVCVIGLEVSKKLFPYEDPIDKRVRIAGTMLSSDVYQVVGVLEPSSGGTEETATYIQFIEHNLKALIAALERE